MDDSWVVALWVGWNPFYEREGSAPHQTKDNEIPSPFCTHALTQAAGGGADDRGGSRPARWEKRRKRNRKKEGLLEPCFASPST